MEDELSIKVNIAGRTYPLTIKREEEEIVRKAANNINENVKHLKENYAVKDSQDLLAMTALEYSTKLTMEKGEVDNEKAIQSLKDIRSLIHSELQ